MSGTTTSPTLVGYDDLGTYSTSTGLYAPNARFAAANTTITYAGSSVPVGGTVTWNDNGTSNPAVYQGYFLNGTTLNPLILQNGNYFLLGDHQGLRSYAIVASPYTACFATGTRIATTAGEIAVESLRIGDRVRLAAGSDSPIRWIGHRSVCIAGHPNPADVLPVRILAGAFAEGLPARDLWLSPDHAVFARDVLIPARYLINDATIVQERADEITYWHVELERHNVLLAEGLPCESYLDTGNRTAFDNATAAMLHPSFAPPATPDARVIWAERACAPLVESGPLLAAVSAQLALRAGPLLPPELTLPLTCQGVTQMMLPAGADRVRLVSDCAHPTGERRRLGAAIAAVALDGIALKLDDAGFAGGFHPAETGFRWTDGSAVLLIAPQDRDRTLSVTVAMLAQVAEPAAA